MIEHLTERFGNRKSEIGIAYFFFDYLDQKVQTAVGILGSLLGQLIRRLPTIPQDVKEVFQWTRTESISLSDARRLFKKVAQLFTKTFICIGALDEGNPDQRDKLLKCLSEAFQAPDARCHFLISGRPHMQSVLEVDHNFVAMGTHLTLQITASKEDITKYVLMYTNQDRKKYPTRMNDDLQDQILKAIVGSSQGM